MGFLSPSQKAAVQAVLDRWIDEEGKDLKLIFAPKYVECASCLNTVDSTYVNNTGLHGGPIASFCTDCGGQGKYAQEVSETIKVRVKYNRGRYEISAPNVFSPVKTVRVRGYLTDLLKFQQAISYTLYLKDSDIVMGKYKLAEDASDISFIQDRYFVATLELLVG
jgi:hypothetical protein